MEYIEMKIVYAPTNFQTINLLTKRLINISFPFISLLPPVSKFLGSNKSFPNEFFLRKKAPKSVGKTAKVYLHFHAYLEVFANVRF